MLEAWVKPRIEGKQCLSATAVSAASHWLLLQCLDSTLSHISNMFSDCTFLHISKIYIISQFYPYSSICCPDTLWDWRYLSSWIEYNFHCIMKLPDFHFSCQNKFASIYEVLSMTALSLCYFVHCWLPVLILYKKFKNVSDDPGKGKNIV